MTPVQTLSAATPPLAARAYQAGDVHEVRLASGNRFLYLASAGAVFEMDRLSAVVLDAIGEGVADHAGLSSRLQALGEAPDSADELLTELAAARVIQVRGEPFPQNNEDVPADFPLQTLVMNLTNQCNLSCEYCYEFGEDKVATPEGKKKFMDFETAKQSVDFLFDQAGFRRAVQITFFGGETLMNYPLLKQVVEYATGEASRRDIRVDYSLTTNATLLTPQIVSFLAEHKIGVTVSMDGPKELHDQFRVFSNGKGSYDMVAPRVKMLIEGHRTRAITARVTMTSSAMDVLRTYRHLKNDLGFHEVGFAPVTTAPNRLYAIGEPGMGSVLQQFCALADEYLEYARRGEMHGFSNVSETLAEIEKGANKTHPCGAALGLVGVGPSGDIAPCHRFVDSDAHSLGNVATGIDKEKQNAFLDRGHIRGKYDCHTCFARPLCAGGCHHEAFVRYGDTGHANLHYCDWIRAWTDKCLQIYATLSVENPEFLRQFAERKAV